MLFNLSIQEILIVLPLLLMSLTAHEYSHALSSTLLGDITPKEQGRLTLNPLRHLDPIGSLLLLVAGFGWAKPVIIDIRQYKNRYLGLTITALAGPLTNLALGIFFLLLLKAGYVNFGMQPTGTGGQILTTAAIVNLVLFALNILPIPPLDGSRIVTALMHRHREFVAIYNRFGIFVLIALFLIERFSGGRLRILGSVFDFVIRTVFQWVFSG